MITTTQEVLDKFVQLPANEKKKVISIILRESLEIDTPALSDDELIFNAEEMFLELDRREAKDGDP